MSSVHLQSRFQDFKIMHVCCSPPIKTAKIHTSYIRVDAKVRGSSADVPSGDTYPGSQEFVFLAFGVITLTLVAKAPKAAPFVSDLALTSNPC